MNTEPINKKDISVEQLVSDLAFILESLGIWSVKGFRVEK